MNKDFLISAFRRVRLRMLSRGGDSDGEDALQEAFCRLWTRDSGIARESEAEGLLTVTMRNIEIDRIRRAKARPEVGIDNLPDCADEDSGRPSEELVSEIDQLMEKSLSERDRMILYRRERDGWEFSEIAEYYGISEANARMITARARKTIREIYRKRNGL